MIYLNNAATSFPKPTQVLESVTSVLKTPPFHAARTGFHGEQSDVVEECRRLLCRLLNAEDASRIVFTSGATESLNLAIRGLDLDGKHVITTAIEHNSVLRPLKTLEKSGRIALTIVDCNQNGCVPPENIANAIQDNTAAILVNHCSNVTGAVNDLHAIGEIAKKRNICFVVDASQSAGVIPIDVQKMNIDFLAFAGHKSLYGIQGTGGAYVRTNVPLQPLMIGGTGVRSDYLFQPEDMPMYFEAGTPNTPGIASLGKGVAFILETGVDAIRAHKICIVHRLREHLAKISGLCLYPTLSCPQPTTLFSFNISGISPDDVGYMLSRSFDIITRSGLHCAPLIHRYVGSFPEGSVRVSPSYFTTEEEVDQFNQAVDKICAVAR